MRIGSYALAASLLALSAPLLLTGCPANFCFLKVCHGRDCRCSISSCGEGAGYDTKTNRCRCLRGFIPLAGQCLSPQEANVYCGRGRHWENGGCVANRCNPGDELDVSTGLCIPRERVNQVATNMGVQVGQGQQLGCPAGQKLVIDGNVAACVPLSQTCAPDETWNGQACVKTGQCATGSVWDPALGQCAQYAQGSGGDELKVNVAQWAQSNYGPNGGLGTPGFCGAFSNKPWSFGISEGSSANVRITVMLSFPEGVIASGVVQSTAVFEASGNPVPPKGAGEITSAAQQIFVPLLQGGGRATTQTASTSVRCTVINAAKPQPIPATGGI